LKKKLIIFDLDGTLIDTLSDIEHIFNYVLKANGIEEKPKLFYKKNIGNGIENLLDKCLPDNYKGDFDNLLQSVKKYYESQLNTKTKIFDGIVSVLEKLKKNKIKIAVISNKLHVLALKSVKKYFGKFDIKVIGAGHNFQRKPNPDSTIHILDFYNILPSDALFIGDSVIDIQTAKFANVSSVGVLWGNGTEKDMKNAGADFILEHPIDILKIL